MIFVLLSNYDNEVYEEIYKSAFTGSIQIVRQRAAVYSRQSNISKRTGGGHSIPKRPFLCKQIRSDEGMSLISFFREIYHWSRKNRILTGQEESRNRRRLCLVFLRRLAGIRNRSRADGWRLKPDTVSALGAALIAKEPAWFAYGFLCNLNEVFIRFAIFFIFLKFSVRKKDDVAYRL